MPGLGHRLVTVLAASRSLTRLLSSQPSALDVLADLDARPPLDAATVDRLADWKRLEFLRIAARDLVGRDQLPRVAAALAELAADVIESACLLSGVEGLAVIGMGKLGGRELNYSSDVDLMFVGDGPAGELEAAAAPGDGHHPPLLPRRRQPAARGSGRSPRPHGRELRGVLGPVGRAVGVPGPLEGGSGGRRSLGRRAVRRDRSAVAVEPSVQRRRPALAPDHEAAHRGDRLAGAASTSARSSSGREASATSSSRCSFCSSCTVTPIPSCARPPRSSRSTR